MKLVFHIFRLLGFLIFYVNTFAQTLTSGSGFTYIGDMKARSALDIDSSSWSIGGETLDRDYADYHSYKHYLGALGAKRIRLQGGWAKCEPVKGKYEFAWLDSIVLDAHSQGVSPWVGLSYGNPIYPEGGEPKLASTLPSSREALAAWDRWVYAIVDRYKKHVTEWEIWNEPDINKTTGISGEDYAKFYIRTAEIIKKIQPDARIFAFGLASIAKLNFPAEFFEHLKKEDKLHWVDVVTFHGYEYNPDDSYAVIKRLEDLCRSYIPDVEMMQGENGCPSTPSHVTIGALNKVDWTEHTQAKWNLRRMLGDHGRGYATNVFTLSDLHYGPGDHMTGVNSKGLLKTFPDKRVDRPKRAYYAVQRVMNLFDSKIQRDSKNNDLVEQSDSLSVFTYFHKQSSKPLLTVWHHGDRPRESFDTISKELSVRGDIDLPIYIDLLTGQIFLIPYTNWEKRDGINIFKNVPIPDYPVVVTDLSVVTERRFDLSK